MPEWLPSNAVVVDRSYGLVPRWLAIGIMAALVIAAFTVSEVSARTSAARDCHQVHEIFAASGEGRNLERARDVAGERGFSVDVEQNGNAPVTDVTLSKNGRRIGWWRVGSQFGAECVHYPGVSRYH